MHISVLELYGLLSNSQGQSGLTGDTSSAIKVQIQIYTQCS